MTNTPGKRPQRASKITAQHARSRHAIDTSLSRAEWSHAHYLAHVTGRWAHAHTLDDLEASVALSTIE